MIHLKCIDEKCTNTFKTTNFEIG